MLWYAHKSYDFIIWYRETIRYERRHCSPHIIISHFFSTLQSSLIYKVPWVFVLRKVQHYDMKKKTMGCCLEKKSMCCKQILIHYIINCCFFSFWREKKYLIKLFNLKTIFVKQVCWCATFWDGGEICVCPCCFALLLSHFSIIKKV